MRSACLPVNLTGFPINYANRLIGSPINYANRLIGSPINYANRSIGSPITSQSTAQVVLQDTPGVVGQQSLHGARHELRVRSAWSAAADADLLVFLVDANRQVRHFPD